MIDNIKVSVVVPVYNVEEYIEECLNSLVAQTLSDIEILLIDDGSTDSSGLICDKYAQEYGNVRVVHKANQGLGSSRNVGFSEAKGKYVYFIDSDDLLEIDALRILYQEAEKDSLDIILFSAECFGEDSGYAYNIDKYKRTAFLDEVKTGKEMFFSLYTVREYYPSIPLRFYRRAYLECNNFSFPEDIIHEDEAYGCLSLLQAKRVKCIAKRFYKRRYRKGSIMTSKRALNSAMGYVHTWKSLTKAYSHLELSEEDKKKYFEFVGVYIYQAMELYFASFSVEDKNKFKTARKEIRDSAYYHELSIGLRIFLISPMLYKLCLKIFNLKSVLADSKKKIRQGCILLEAILQLFIVHNFCKDRNAAILIGTPTHGNLGDQAIVYAEHKFLEKFKKKINIVEITSQLYLKYKELLGRLITEKDLIIIDGGGSMGTLWINNEYRFRDVIERFAANSVFIFPQTAYFAKDAVGLEELEKSVEIYSRHKRLTIFCRDRETYNFVQKEFHSNESYYVPDMVLSLQRVDSEIKNRNGVLLCLREDKECIVQRSLSDTIERFVKEKGVNVKKTSTLTGGYIDKFNRKKELQNKWNEFSGASLVITDRLHAMIFCAITGTPCIAFDNVSHKVRGGYEWLKHLSYINFLEPESLSKELISDIIEHTYEEKNVDLVSEYEKLQRLVEGRN